MNHNQQKDIEGDVYPIRTVLFCKTASSAANPIYSTLKELSEEDIISHHSDDKLLDKIEEVANEKTS